MSEAFWDNTPQDANTPQGAPGYPGAPIPNNASPDYGPMLMEGLGFIFTGIPGLGWVYLGEWGKFGALFVTYLAITAFMGAPYFLEGFSDTLGLVAMGLECVLGLGIIGLVGFSTWKVYQYTRTYPYEKSFKRVIFVVISIWMFYCVMIVALVALVTTLMAIAGS